MHYNDRETLGLYELWTPDSDMNTVWDDEVFTILITENHKDGPVKAATWLTTEAAAQLAKELNEWVRSMNR
jgi:hypothetical protein